MEHRWNAPSVRKLERKKFYCWKQALFGFVQNIITKK